MHNITTPLVSIIVPVFNEETLVSESLSSLLKQDYPKERLEIIVVDNGSTDRSAEMIRKFPVQYVLEEKKGAGAARNTGARHANGEFVAFIDADCTAHTDWISKLVSYFEKGPYDAVGGDCRIFSRKSLIDHYLAHRDFYSQAEFFSSDYSFFPWLVTSNLMVHRSTFFKVGGFDETLVRGEDIDFSWRLIQSGFLLQYIPSFEVLNRGSSNLWNFYLKLFKDGKASILIRYRYEALTKHKTGGRNITQSEQLFTFLNKIKLRINQIFMKKGTANILDKIGYLLLALTGHLTFSLGKGVSYIRYGILRKTLPVPVLSHFSPVQENLKGRIDLVPA